MYGRGRGFGMGIGRGMGLGQNLSGFCRRFPQSPPGWWSSPAYPSQIMPPAANLMMQPGPGIYHPQFPTLPQQQSFLTHQIPYMSGMGLFGGSGMGMGLGRGFNMGYRRRFGQFPSGVY
ncbi:hypothetical protein KEJ39_06270 [Candidatus Bathyarchaeota archaeon]|nr:hypothetical protein [Candidatus Bathyarchaeota archaeon]